VSYFTLRWSSKKMQTDGLSRPASGALRTALVQATGSVKKGPAFVVEEFDHDSPPSVRAGSPAEPTTASWPIGSIGRRLKPPA
jgi:hypothetical protein